MPLNISPTYITQWNASYQHQFGGNWLATFTYLGNKSTHLWVTQHVNPSVYIPGTCNGSPCSTTANTQARRVLTLLNPSQGQYLGMIEEANDGSNSEYNALLCIGAAPLKSWIHAPRELHLLALHQRSGLQRRDQRIDI